jgi:hypothetical protein
MKLKFVNHKGHEGFVSWLINPILKTLSRLRFASVYNRPFAW